MMKLKLELFEYQKTNIKPVVLFGKTAKQWRKNNSNAKGNIRDMATIQQLVVLPNLGSINIRIKKLTDEEPD